MQRLESEPDMEFHALNRALRGLLPTELDDAARERLRAWTDGRTGYPMIDACMRALHATGWLNFRMRAMLVSFATHHLHLPWRETGLTLARLWLDHEPGIHWAQVQMQSGMVGINRLRVYSPTRQGARAGPGRRLHPPLGARTDGRAHRLRSRAVGVVRHDPHRVPATHRAGNGRVPRRARPPERRARHAEFQSPTAHREAETAKAHRG